MIKLWTRQIRPVIFWLFCLSCTSTNAWKWQFGALSRTLSGQTFIPAVFNQTYSGTINSTSVSVVYAFNYTRLDNETDAIRVTISSSEDPDKLETTPILVVIKQQLGVLSWQLPQNIDRNYPFMTTSRTLCPTINYQNEGENSTANGTVIDQDLYVDISTASPVSVNYKLFAYRMTNFFLKTNEALIFNVTPAEPQYVEYVMPAGIDRVLVTLDALEEEHFCSYFSIQPVQCPVADQESELRAEGGMFQTVTSRGAIVVTRGEYPRFYVVVTVKPVDLFCRDIETILPPKQAKRPRVKTIKLTVTESLSSRGYAIAIAACVSFFSGFYVITCILISGNIVKWKYCFGKADRETANSPDVSSQGPVLNELEKDLEGNPIPTPNDPEKTTTTGSSNPGENSSGGPVARNVTAASRTSSSSSIEEDVDFGNDLDDDKNVVLGKTWVYVADLTRKSRKRLSKKDRQYRWSMITICIFYGLPVAQLVITYQRVLKDTGNEDICYYNFACANPLSMISDFNHVFSNIGYVMLGVLFMLLVRRRQLQYIKRKTTHPIVEGQEQGIPPQFELFYAMGLALMMEGLMSASYHICPSYSNFQFDTSFMYLIGGLGMLKIYQARHPDILPNAYISYAFFALIILMAVFGVVYISVTVWIVFSVLLMLLTLSLSAQIYYLGRWSLDRGIIKRIYTQIRSHGFIQWPAYKDRFALLSFLCLINWTLAIMGPIWQPLDFASYLLLTFVTNFALYVLYYLVMKLLSGERISRLTILFILLSAGTWAGSLYLFYKGPVNWQVTPSRSREVNQPCTLLKFYDKHDIWHMTSACSLFFSFMVMLTLDDDLLTVYRTNIVVF